MPPLRELHRSKDRLPLPHLKLQVEERKPEKIKSAPHKSYYKARRCKLDPGFKAPSFTCSVDVKPK